ncbi:MAG: hypothetical protein HY238_10440, partial [Acidobacteria bacterium]|nr:hypothetical protein [Acidobacteriota bacterium]
MPATRVGVMVSFDQPPNKDFLKQLRREVQEIFRPSGLDLTWEIRGKTRPSTYHRVILLDFRGRCGSNRLDDTHRASAGRERLGGTMVSDGEVIPFVVVDCDAMAVLVQSMRTQVASKLFLPGIYNRLAGRVTAHELMHALLRTTDHHSTDRMRPFLRASDLLSEARLTPTEIAALRLAGRASSSLTLAQ